MTKITWGNAQPEEMFKGIKTIDEVASKLGEIGFKVKSWRNEAVSGISPYKGDFFSLYQTYDITDSEGVKIWVNFYYGDKTKKVSSVHFYIDEEFIYVDFESDSKEEEKDNGKKKAVSIKEAENLFFEKVNERDIANKLYEFALNIKENIIEEINTEHVIVDENGEIFDGSDDTEWHDDIEHEALDAIYDKIGETLPNCDL